MASLLLAIALVATSKATPAVTPAPASGAVPLVGVAPALTATALRDELRARSQQRREELAALARQKEELQRLAAEVAAARMALDAAQRAPAADPKGAPPKDDKGDAARDAKPSVASPATSPEALAKTVKGMKSDQAAILVQKLDRGLAVEVLRRMRPADTAAILEKLKPDTAAELFSAMAARGAAPAQGQR